MQVFLGGYISIDDEKRGVNYLYDHFSLAYRHVHIYYHLLTDIYDTIFISYVNNYSIYIYDK